MRLTLRQLTIFLAVAQRGSTSDAALELNLSQSATSAALNDLERLLEARLFDRVGKRLQLNDNGRLLLLQARPMLAAASTIEQQFAAGATALGANLEIGASTTIGIYLLPALLAAAPPPGAGACPRVTIANSADVANAVVQFKVDFGLIEGPCHAPDLQADPWLRDELIIVAAPGHAIFQGAQNDLVKKRALREARWLMREPGSGTREAVEQALLPHLHYLHSAGEYSNSEAIKYAAAQGLGVACLSRLVVADLMSMGRLVELKTGLPTLYRHFYLLVSRRKVMSEGLKAFLAFTRDWSY